MTGCWSWSGPETGCTPRAAGSADDGLPRHDEEHPLGVGGDPARRAGHVACAAQRPRSILISAPAISQYTSSQAANIAIDPASACARVPLLWFQRLNVPSSCPGCASTRQR